MFKEKVVLNGIPEYEDHEIEFRFDFDRKEFYSYRFDNDPVVYGFTLDVFLKYIDICIPEDIDYCLAHNMKYKIKYRKTGYLINLYIRQYNFVEPNKKCIVL